MLFLVLGGVGLVSLAGFLYKKQDILLYYPNMPHDSRTAVMLPSDLNLQYEDIFVTVGDIEINMYFIKQCPEALATAPTMIFFHGNAGNIGHRLENARDLHRFSGMNILLVEYRGYGRSTGSPSESGLTEDAKAAFDYLLNRQDIDHNKIYIFGRSLGGAVAIALVSDLTYAQQASGLIVENTFTSLPDIARHLIQRIPFPFRVINKLPQWYHKNKYPSKERIERISLPTLFLSGLDDEIVPPAMMEDLYQTSGSHMKRESTFVNGTHNETWCRPGYYDAINSFVAEVTP